MLLLATCDLGLLHLLLGTLIPFLLGLALGYLLWYRYKNQIKDLNEEINALRLRISGLESENRDWNNKYDTKHNLVGQLKTEITNINKNLSSKDLLIGSLTTEKNNLSGEFKTLSARISELEKATTECGSKLKREQDLVAKLNAEIADLQAKINKAGSATIIPVPITPVVEKEISEDLKKIEGIGPETEGLLFDSGINTFEKLADSKVDHLQGILEKGGPRFQLLVPATWPQQARLAADGKWDELEELQDYLIGGIDPVDLANRSRDEDIDLNAATAIFEKSIDLNDLTIIEGIGPVLSKLLNDNNIATWRDLANARVDALATIMDEHGMQMHDPASWPRQAAMAVAGKWSDLKKWQDILSGGKE